MLQVEFLISDFVGRWIPSYIILPSYESGKLWIPVGLRYLLYPLFLLCLYHAPIASSDWFPLALTALLGLGNGYYCSLAMMFGPMEVKQSKEKELAGYIMVCMIEREEKGRSEV